MNLRNHRKVLVVDGRVGFTGGMNVRDDFLPAPGDRPPYMDLQVRVEGPVVAHLQSAFAEDWALHHRRAARGGRASSRRSAAAGTVVARGVADGPDEDFEAMRLAPARRARHRAGSGSGS